MLKKAGIIAATAAAGLVVLTPLAFASDENSVEGNQECSQEATQGGNATGVQSGALLNLIGGIAAAAPVQAQIPVLNCVDASDDDFTDTDTKVKIADNDFDFGGRH